MKPGKLVVFSAPSGAGKSSLISSVMTEVPRLRSSVSATTRQPRTGEIDGIHYFFMERMAFEAMIAAGELAEWNEVHGNLYGTPRPFLDGCTANGEHVVLVSPTGKTISLPNHAEVKRPTLKQLLRFCGIEDKAYRRAFDQI